jgi:ABC-2 type transport system ATP-binding protein
VEGEAIGLIGVRRKFGRVQALDGVTLSARTGEVYGFLGRNGAGKTTTLRVLMGIVKPDEGEIALLGERVKKVSIELKQRIGYVSQEQVFYPWMTAAQLGRFVAAFYPSWDAAEYARLLKLLDVPDNRRAVELSGGTRTKLGLALALAPRPPLLLLDEPTTGLDPVARTEFNELVQLMVRERGITAFLSSHLVDEVQDIADRVGIIQAGRMSFEGEVPVLRARVRRVRAPEPLAPSSGFSRVYGEIWQADPELWAAEAWPEGTEVEALSLEDIFVAFARSSASATPLRNDGA